MESDRAAHALMKIKVGVMGSAADTLSDEAAQTLRATFVVAGKSNGYKNDQAACHRD